MSRPLVSGGIDVDPEVCGESSGREPRPVVRSRDEFEIAPARAALERDQSTLAICRGHHVLNVATGGTPQRQVPSVVAGGERHYRAGPRGQRVHAVDVGAGTVLSSLLDEGVEGVNGIHHQAVARVGAGMAASARGPGDDFVEAIEMPRLRLVLGVEWHPGSLGQTGGLPCPFDAHAEARGHVVPAESR